MVIAFYRCKNSPQLCTFLWASMLLNHGSTDHAKLFTIYLLKKNALFWEEDCNQSREAKNTIPVAFARFQEYWVVKPQTPASKPVSLQTFCNFMIWNKYVLSSPYRRLGCIKTPWKQPRRFKIYKESASDFLLRFIWAPLREKERDLLILEPSLN